MGAPFFSPAPIVHDGPLYPVPVASHPGVHSWDGGVTGRGAETDDSDLFCSNEFPDIHRLPSSPHLVPAHVCVTVAHQRASTVSIARGVAIPTRALHHRLDGKVCSLLSGEVCLWSEAVC